MRMDGQATQMKTWHHSDGSHRKGMKLAFLMRANHYHVFFAPSNALKSYFLSFASENRHIIPLKHALQHIIVLKYSHRANFLPFFLGHSNFSPYLCRCN